MNREPIFIAGPDRSGTTLLYALMASHPNISMSRRTNFWRWFYGRYGALSEKENFERCLGDMLNYKRMQRLAPDGERIRAEFWQGAPSYGRLFSLFLQHNAERIGKPRWGDKSLHTEHYTDQLFAEFPNAKIIHTTRDPRDRYASVRKRFGRDNPRMAAATGRWLASMRAAEKNLKQYPGNYMVITFENLASDPEGTLRNICGFIGEDYAPEMLTMQGAAEYRESGGNSSFNKITPGAISTSPIGRFRSVLTPTEIAFIQKYAGETMEMFGYQRVDVQLSFEERLRFNLLVLPFHSIRMLGWMALDALVTKRIARVPAARLTNSNAVPTRG